MDEVEIAKKIIEKDGDCVRIGDCKDCPGFMCSIKKCALVYCTDSEKRQWMQDWLDKQDDYINESGAESEQVGGEHYKNFKRQPAKFITENNLGLLEGCIIKRDCRHKAKNGVEDLRKIIHEVKLLALYEYGKEI